MLAPKLMEFQDVVMEAMFSDGSGGMRPSNIYKPRAWRWLNTKQALNKSFEKVDYKEDALCFRSYFYTPQGTRSLSCLGR